MPGGKFVKLNTVIVDALEGEDGLYDDMIIFACIDALDEVPVTEF